MNKCEDAVNSLEASVEDEQLRVALIAAYPASESSTALKERVADIAVQSSASAPPGLWKLRPRLESGRRALGAMAVITAVCIGLVFTSTYLSRPTPAFAQVERAIQEVKTAHWITTRTWATRDGKVMRKSTEKVWVRLDPPAYASQVLTPARYKGSRSVIDAKGQVLYDPTLKRYLTNPMIRAGANLNLKELVRRLILADVLAPGVDRGGSSFNTRTIQGDPAWTSKPITVEGKSLIRFYREYAGTNSRVQQTIWADFETYRVVRCERRMIPYKADSLVRLDINEQYHFDEEPPKGTFDLKRPPKATNKSSR